jgi:tRNA/rRNA methyltransferase
MANLGAERLLLVDPRCEVNSKAKQAAAGAQRRLQEHTRYANWDEFYANEPEGVRIALTRRAGKKRPVVPLEEALRTIKRKRRATPLYLIFGPEADGLDASDLGFVHECCTLPVHGDFASYNLAQAVLLTLFMTRQVFPAEQAVKPTEAAQPFYFPDESIREWLTAMGFDIQARRASAYLTLKRLLLQKYPTEHEMRVLDAILQQNIRKLRQSKDEATT